MNFINLTPHDINLNSGEVFPPSGIIARVSSVIGDFDTNGIASTEYGEVEHLPDPKEDTMYIVSGMVLANCHRSDVVAPATGHPACVRNDKGHIISVPGFIRS